MHESGYGGRVVALLLFIGLIVVTVPGSAGAATTVGEASPIVPTCFDDDVALVQSRVAGPPTYTVPFDGVLTDFTAWGETIGDQTKLLVLNPPSSGTLYNVAAKSEFATFNDVGLSTFSVQVPARAGQVVALFNNPCFLELPSPPTPDDVVSTHTGPDPPVGSDAEFVQSGTNERVTLSATLEPDCDADGIGDDTQDSSTASCHPRTLTLDANKNKVRRGKKVRLSGQILETSQGGACAASQAVVLQRRKASQSFATVQQLQTNAAGAFSAKQKVRKTFEYRAQIPETATCGTALSNTEKVKVKKKRRK